MIEKYGDLFDTDAKYIAHGVNCRGVMGAGIAVQFKKRFPEMYAGYHVRCTRGELYPGGFWVGTGMLNGRTVLVVNLASQEKPGADASYPWLFRSLCTWAEQASEPNRLRLYGGIIAVPEIGCGIGGLEWDKVRRIYQVIEDFFPDIEFEVWHCDG